ncbi:hypothetical protein [Arthrobacter sp. SLBN-53]|uniref:hypothetical protein n=1 Tax=Arthrobacter sp. SLBN-53 TaxID=2768412 RepID=UPI001152E990|nr:hypothetical protein [Arthrobacter sp. SLBN-53]TQK31779.1 hypothetical protein FBY28_4819 [Arthrobacter sp. SLBN-53]
MGVAHDGPLVQRIERVDPETWAREVRRAAELAASLAEKTGRKVPEFALRVLSKSEEDLVAERVAAQAKDPTAEPGREVTNEAAASDDNESFAASAVARHSEIVAMRAVQRALGRFVPAGGFPAPTVPPVIGMVRPAVGQPPRLPYVPTNVSIDDAYLLEALQEVLRILDAGNPQLAKIYIEAVLQDEPTAYLP